jgi:hypothetical protein
VIVAKAAAMTLSPRRASRPALLLAAGALALSSVVLTANAADAARGDRDGDGMPNRWEARHGLDPDRADAGRDRDRDGLSNLGEYRHGGDPADEDTDRDGDDDGDEIHGHHRTHIDDRDSDDDGIRDGDEDADHDGTDNEDEDDAGESCASDDDDRDADHVSDEDENDYGYRAGDDDSDDDGITDGEEDHDGDGVSDEDDDDSVGDSCAHSGEDTDDLLGTIVSFDAVTGALEISTARSGLLTFVVTAETEVEFDGSGHGSGDAGSVEDLDAGVVVLEVDLEKDGTLQEIELARS